MELWVIIVLWNSFNHTTYLFNEPWNCSNHALVVILTKYFLQCSYSGTNCGWLSGNFWVYAHYGRNLQEKMDGGITVTHTWRSLHMMPMATHLERGHQLRVVIRAQTGMNGWILAHEHGGISKSVSMMMTIMQMMHCLIKLLGPYLHMCHALMWGWTATEAM